MDNPLAQIIQNRREMIAKLQQVIVEELSLNTSPQEIDPDAPLFGTGLQLDSIDAVELVVCVERAFEVKLGKSFNVYEMRTLNKMGDAIQGARLQVSYE